ncbi:ATP-binding protein [Sporocytophaga myxococcoides]|uniref:ATP-binding protein n=1 Tax=Sporocytophaga myxococcoides TaxID=153721 RepID=UPI0004246095|nr:ATP-binding protein [Sporocytophaga myxococcoides]
MEKKVNKPFDEFSRLGEMGALIASKDWEQTSLGPIEQWSASLKSYLKLMLGSKYQMWLGWGQEYLKFYNEAYAPTLGVKHPESLGKSAKIIWKEVWDVVGPMWDRVMNSGDSLYYENLLLILERHGFKEETYHTFSYSPLPDDNGDIGGFFCAVSEETKKVISQRRLTTLHDLSNAFTKVKTEKEVLNYSSEILKRNPNDIPFALIYLFDKEQKHVILKEAIGAESGQDYSPLKIDLQSVDQDIWRFSEILSSHQNLLIEDLTEFSYIPQGPWDECPTKAMILPLLKSGQDQLAGFLISGISSRLIANEEYTNFLGLVTGQLSTALGNIRALEEERRRAEALAEIDKSKTVFFSNISHEFRTPLTLILGPVKELISNNSFVNQDDKEQLNIIHRNSLRLLKLVNTLLDFSRLEAGRVQAVFRETDLARFTSELSSSFQSVVESAGLTFTVSAGKISEPVYVDHTMWERILFNLISNAYKFTFKGSIGVYLEQVDQQIELRVKDTGTGISESELPKLFSRFHRIENAKGRTHEGSGIGLAMVYELVKIHYGSIRVESKTDKGTTFIVSIPMGKAHLPEDRIASLDAKKTITLNALPNLEEEWYSLNSNTSEYSVSTPLGVISSDKKTERILVADDNPDMREYISRLLRDHYEVIEAGDGEAALNAIKTENPSLVLSDVMMPNLDGIGLVKQLRSVSQTSTLPVILISARANEEATIEGIKAGADDYLIKPFSSKELFARVQTHLEMADLRKEAKEAVNTERQKLYDLFMQAPAIIAVLKGPEHTFELANPRYMQLVGQNRNIIGKPIREALPELAGQGFYDILDDVYESGKSYSGNEAYVKLDRNNDGQLDEAFVNFIYQPMVDVKGSIYGILVYADEVTEQVKSRKQVEEQNKVLEMITKGHPLSESLSQLLLSVEKWSDHEMIGSVLLLDDDEKRLWLGAAPSLPEEYSDAIDGIYISESVGLCGTAAFLKKEVIVQDIAADPLWKKFKGLALKHGLRACWSTPILSGDKVLGTFAIYYKKPHVPDYADKKNVEFALRTITIAIERKRAEERLQASKDESDRQKRLYETITGNTLDLIYVFDLNYRFTYANEALLRMWGSTFENSIGKTLLENGYEPWHAEMHEKEIDQIVATKKPIRGVVSFPHATLGKRDYDYIFVPVMNEYGEVEAVAGTTRDITDIKNAENSLAEKNKELISINNDLDNFIYTASHDLKAPISNIEGLVESMLENIDEEARANKEFNYILSLINTSIQRFKATILDLTEISKVQKQTQEIAEEINCREVIEEVKFIIQDQIKASGAVVKIDDSSVSQIKFSRKNFQSIVYNLISNAVKYRHPDRCSEVFVNIEYKDKLNILTVKDNGMGIGESNINKLFTMFKRFHDHVEGSGVGLYIVKRIIDNAGGKVEVESKEGIGTTFRVYLPIPQ